MSKVAPSVPDLAWGISLLAVAAASAAAASDSDPGQARGFSLGAGGTASLFDSSVADAESSRWSELWENVGASGIWRFDYFSSSKQLDDETHFLDATLQLKALPRFTDTLSGKVEMRVTQSVEREVSTRGRLVEGYLTARFAQADLHVGKQIVAWGRADGINPTDNLTPRDYTVQLPFEDDQRLGTPSMRLDIYLTPTRSLTVFTTPFFEPARVPLPTAGYEVIERTPAVTLSNTEAGVRLNEVAEGFDWSVSAYRGFNLQPSVRLPIADQDRALMELTYDRITVFGADAARNFGRFGLRAELAYLDTSDDEGTDPVTRNPQLYWILGIDRTFYENLNVNLQYFQRRIRHHRSPGTFESSDARLTAHVNAIFNAQRDAVSDGISFRVSNKWLNETLEAEVFCVANLTRDDSFARAVVTYAFDDHWRVTVGGEYYRGAPDTQYGSLSDNTSGFVEVRYGF